MTHRKTPINAQERARKNVEEGRGAGISDYLKKEAILIMNLVHLIQCGEHP